MNQPSDPSAEAPARRRRFGRPLCFVLGPYLGVIALLAFMETTLVYPVPPRDAGEWSPDFDYEPVDFQSADGTPLHGWLLPAKEETELWIVYFHGNGDHVAFSGPWLDGLREHLPAHVFVFDYRGYGRSGGKPHEAGVLADGEAAVAWVAERCGRDPGELTLIGRSLGGAVAVHVAAKHGARGVVLERTFTRLTDAAAARYWWMPVRWLMRNRYDSIDKIPAYRGPLLCSHGDRDGLVPYELGRKLFDAAGTPENDKLFFTLEDVGHNDPSPPEYQAALVEFLRRTGSRPVESSSQAE